jgi:hypothetical protein
MRAGDSVHAQAHGISGDIRLFPMEKNVWDAQIIITQTMVPTEKTISPYPAFVKIW